MFKKIMVPLDGSAFAERALPVAERLAVSFGGDIALVRVVALVAPGEREPGVISYLDEQRVATAAEYVQAAAATLRLGRPVSAEAYLAADVTAGILARARDLDADVIVMASRGEPWPEEGMLASTAYALLDESDIPIFVVGPRCNAATPAQSSIATALHA